MLFRLDRRRLRIPLNLLLLSNIPSIETFNTTTQVTYFLDHRLAKFIEVPILILINQID